MHLFGSRVAHFPLSACTGLLNGSCFLSVFAAKIFELAVKTAEKQTKKQPKNSRKTLL